MNDLMPVGAFSQSVPPTDDEALVNRICAAYRISSATFGRSDEVGNSEWTTINGWKAAIHEALTSGIGAAEVLRNPCANNLLFGFESLYEQYTGKLRSMTDEQGPEAYYIVAVLHRLAQAAGISRIPNPEAPDRDVYREQSHDNILCALDAEFGFEIRFPNPYPDEYGVPTTRGIMSQRALFAVYQAHRLRQLMHLSDTRSVIEIGAGLGRTAFYTQGFDYTIVDLPIANAAQAYFLGRTVGESSIRLAGEQHDAPIKIMPPTYLHDKETDVYLKAGVVLNADSLTEMDRSFSEKYVAHARDHAKLLLSINHEVKDFTATEIIRSVAPKATLMRFLHQVRPGYIEEIAFFQRATPASFSDRMRKAWSTIRGG